MTRRGWTLLAAAVLSAAAFAYQNRFEGVAMQVGPLRFYAVPLPLLVFAAFLLGMAAMLLLALPADRRTRELLRAHGLLDAPAAPPRGAVTTSTAAAAADERTTDARSAAYPYGDAGPIA